MLSTRYYQGPSIQEVLYILPFQVEDVLGILTAHDIVEILKDPATKIPQADVVIGGPPCQGFSLLNKKRENDPRKELWRPFLEVVKRSNASIFVMENVPQLLGTAEHEEIIRAAESLGFTICYDKLLAANFGVPQKRTRAFIIGCKFDDPSLLFPPRKTHFKPRNGEGQLSFTADVAEDYLPNCRYIILEQFFLFALLFQV